MQQKRGPGNAHHRLHQLDLADLGHRPDRQSAIPGEEAEEHADHREIGEREPLLRRCGWRLPKERDTRQCDHQRRGQDESPRHRLPRAQLTSQQSAFGVPDRGGEDGTEQQQVRPAEVTEPTALQDREDDGRNSTQRGEHPERPGGPLMGTKDGHDGSRCR